MNEEHKNFQEKEMRDLERERENPIFRGNTPWVNFHGGGVHILINQSIFGYTEEMKNKPREH